MGLSSPTRSDGSPVHLAPAVHLELYLPSGFCLPVVCVPCRGCGPTSHQERYQLASGLPSPLHTWGPHAIPCPSDGAKNQTTLLMPSVICMVLSDTLVEPQAEKTMEGEP